MPLEEMVFGEEISRQEDEASGWIVAHSRKKQRQDFTPGDSPGLSAGNSAARPAHPKGPITSSSPRRACHDCLKITTGLSCVQREAWMCARNAEAYAKVKQIRVGETLHEVSTYVTPPGDTCRGVVRGIDPELSDDRLGELFVHARNPKVLGVRRIKQTPTVIVLFDGMKVPNYVMCGTNMIRCTSTDDKSTPVEPAENWDIARTFVLPLRSSPARTVGSHRPLRITRASRSAPSVEERIRRQIGPAKAGTRSPTSFGVEGDDAEKQTSSAGSSCHSKLPGSESTRGADLILLGRVRVTALARG
ncbi:hypothetical protein HPB52_011435 [Rhipicephalus sanguineus]|uniref:Uncharacterized protein n=1 Tax=Rhipicephalus sanguineus TaxID=34632 RepID=A0A9D4T3K5_RHISA|nr:hypothetical protein HPB52_011435 [Rhipicephalus sanguineus]